MKYLVMECHTGYAVLLDEEGRFVKAANLHYEEGQTVEEPVLMKEPASNRKKKVRVVMGLAAAAACFFLMFNSYYQNYMLPDTAIYLTINPSVCMELNRKGSVVRLTGVNEDGRKLLENYKRSSNDRLAVTDELIDRAIEMGFLSEGGRVVIDIDAPDQTYFQKYGMELRSNLTEHLESTLKVEIQIVEHGQEIPEEDVPSEEKSEEKSAPASTPQESEDGISDYQESGYEETPYEESSYEEEPASEESVYEEKPVSEESPYEESAYEEESASEESAYEESAYEEKPASEESAYEESSYEEESGYGESAYEEESGYE